MMDILEEIKESVLSIEPDAEVYLFGSRARGDYRVDSDWDILVLLHGKVDGKRKEKIWNAVYEIDFKYNTTSSISVRSKEFWNNSPVYQETEFYRNLNQEMVMI